MRPAFSSSTKRRGATALATSLRLFFLAASDMWHPYGDLTRNWSALDRDCAANTCRDIEWDDRRWNGCASSLLAYGAAHPLPRTYTFRAVLALPSWCNIRQLVCRCLPHVIAPVSVELSARTCKSKRIQTSGEIRALAKSRCRQVRHGAWKSGEA